MSFTYIFTFCFTYSSFSFGGSFERTNRRGATQDPQTLEEDNCHCGGNIQHGRGALQTS